MRASRALRSAHDQRRSPLLITATAAVLIPVGAGCSAPAADPTAAAPSAQSHTLPSAHVHAVAIDPGDGTLLLATHEGLVEVGPAGELIPIGPVIDLMGFTVAGPDHYLASGHPGLQVDLPQPVGLIESTDGGHTWAPLSRQGQSDFHALTVIGDAGALGWDGALRRSTDGRTWEQLAIPAEPHTLAAAPDDRTVLATTQQGLLRSTDGGATWGPIAGTPLLQVVGWSGDGSTAVGVDPAGSLWVSADSGSTWERRAQLDAAPHAVAVDGAASRIAVVTDEGLLESADGGRTFTVVLGT